MRSVHARLYHSLRPPAVHAATGTTAAVELQLDRRGSIDVVRYLHIQLAERIGRRRHDRRLFRRRAGRDAGQLGLAIDAAQLLGLRRVEVCEDIDLAIARLALRPHVDAAIARHAGAGRDELADDDVL